MEVDHAGFERLHLTLLISVYCDAHEMRLKSKHKISGRLEFQGDKTEQKDGLRGREEARSKILVHLIRKKVCKMQYAWRRTVNWHIICLSWHRLLMWPGWLLMLRLPGRNRLN